MHAQINRRLLVSYFMLTVD